MDESGTALRAMSENRERLRHECGCVLCPTYTPCAAGEHELLFCFIGGSSRCITEDLGFICPSCPVAEKIGLERLAFCLLGTEVEQRDSEHPR